MTYRTEAERAYAEELAAQHQQAMDNIEAGDAHRAAGCPPGEILHPRDLYALRTRVAELEAEAIDLKNDAVRFEEMYTERDVALSVAVDRLAELEAGLPAAWAALTDEQRYELAHSVCRGCGSLDTKCQCWNDE
jgi:hypothetical protein